MSARALLQDVQGVPADDGRPALEDLFPDRVQWDLMAADVAVRLGDGPGGLRNAAEALSALDGVDALIADIARLGVYANMRLSVEGRSAATLDDVARVQALRPPLAQRQAVLDWHLARVSESRWRAWCTERPGLAAHAPRHAARRSARRHNLPLAAESLLAALDGPLQSGWPNHRRIQQGDLRFAPVADRHGKVTPFTLTRYEKHFECSSDAVLRRHAWESFTEGVAQHQHAFAALYATEVDKQLALARQRGYRDVTDSLLAVQRLPREAYEAQLATLRTELPAVMRRFVRIKQRWLGLNSLGLHDLKANPPATDVEIGYAQAAVQIRAAARRFDAGYADVIDQAFAGRWIDHGDRPGKPAGAGCAATYGPHPYVTLTWGGRPRDVFLLAHELGHLVHFHRAAQACNASNAYAPRYLIEAPSTFNELLLAEHLLREAQGAERAGILLELLHSYFHNFVTHFHEADFQDRVYRSAEAGLALSAERLAQTKAEVLRDFWGDAVALDERAGLLWTRQHHYYMGLYPSTYAAGQTVATLAWLQWREDPTVSRRWLAWLDQGTSQPPLQLLAPLGIDPRRPETHQAAVRHIGALVDELDSLVDTSGQLSGRPVLQTH